MALCREIDDDIGPFLLKETEDALSVADIELDKAEVGLFKTEESVERLPHT